MNCLLTGGAGIVGSHIIFEWLQKAIVDKTVNHLFVVIRNNEKTAKNRLINILQDKSRPDFLNAFSLEQCLEKVTVITADLTTVSKKNLEKYNFDSVIHCAGSTNLASTNDSKNTVHNQNYKVTKHLLEQLPQTVNRFIYISTAFSFGIQNEKVHD
ncbi:MAG: SDR family oxidoreductase, partial [Polaribacter sp.]